MRTAPPGEVEEMQPPGRSRRDADDDDELKEQADTPLAEENKAHQAKLEKELAEAPEEEEPAAE